MDLLMQYLIICPLVMLAGFIDAIAGGGGLISLPAYMIAGIPVHHAIATNKMSSTMGTALATFKFARKGFIPWKIALSCVVCAFAGSTLGANLALLVNAHIFMLFMIIVLPLTAVYVQKTKILSMAMALLIGVYDGFYGPGTGTFLLLLLTGVAHLSIHKANGVTKAINLTTNVAALCVFLLNAKVLFPLGIIAGLFGMAGNWLGASYFANGSARNVKPIIMIVLGIFFLNVIYELFFK